MNKINNYPTLNEKTHLSYFVLIHINSISSFKPISFINYEIKNLYFDNNKI